MAAGAEDRGGGAPGSDPVTRHAKAGADESQEANQPREANPSSARAPGAGGARRRRGGRGRGSGGGAARVATSSSDERTAEADDKVEAEVDVETVPVADQADHAARFTDELVRTMGFSASVRTEIDEDDVTVHIEGDGLGALVGPSRGHDPGARGGRARGGAAPRRRAQRLDPRRRRRVPRTSPSGARRVRPSGRGRGQGNRRRAGDGADGCGRPQGCPRHHLPTSTVSTRLPRAKTPGVGW